MAIPEMAPAPKKLGFLLSSVSLPVRVDAEREAQLGMSFHTHSKRLQVADDHKVVREGVATVLDENEDIDVNRHETY